MDGLALQQWIGIAHKLASPVEHRRHSEQRREGKHHLATSQEALNAALLGHASNRWRRSDHLEKYQWFQYSARGTQEEGTIQAKCRMKTTASFGEMDLSDVDRLRFLPGGRRTG